MMARTVVIMFRSVIWAFAISHQQPAPVFRRRAGCSLAAER